MAWREAVSGDSPTAADVDPGGSFWLGPDGEVWRCVSFCEYPTVSWARVSDPSVRRGGAVGSPLAREFRRLHTADPVGSEIFKVGDTVRFEASEPSRGWEGMAGGA